MFEKRSSGMPSAAARREDGLQRELDLGLGGLAVLVVGGLTDAHDRDPAADAAFRNDVRHSHVGL
jgi:hypothetical protein